MSPNTDSIFPHECCQTIIPRKYTLVLHSNARAESYDPGGKPLGPVEGDRYHRDFGHEVVQIFPSTTGTRTVFLHVLTAVDGTESIAPNVTYRAPKRGVIELSVDGAATSLDVPEWFEAIQ